MKIRPRNFDLLLQHLAVVGFPFLLPNNVTVYATIVQLFHTRQINPHQKHRSLFYTFELEIIADIAPVSESLFQKRLNFGLKS